MASRGRGDRCGWGENTRETKRHSRGNSEGNRGKRQVDKGKTGRQDREMEDETKTEFR